MKGVCGIYKITSPKGRVYIGQSVDCGKREARYARLDCKEQTMLYRSIVKYGWAAHRFEVIHNCSEHQLDSMETHYIALYGTFDSETGLNLQSGGNRPKLSLETRFKIGQKSKGNKNMLGRAHSEETKRKIGEALKGRLQPPISDATRTKMRQSHIGKIPSKETREKLREARKGRQPNKGKKLSDAHKKKLHEACKNRVVTDESRKKISSARMGMKFSEAHRNNLSVAIRKYYAGKLLQELKPELTT